MNVQGDVVERALAILREADFPIEQIRILPPATAGGAGVGGEAALDRAALLEACCAILQDGHPRPAKELARLASQQLGHKVTRRDVNSVLSNEGKDRVMHDRDTHTHQLRR